MQPVLNPDCFSEIDAALLAKRRKELLDAAWAQGLSAVIVFGHGSALGAGTKSHGALRFLSDWDGHESASLLLCTAAGATLMVASPFVAPLARLRRPDLELLDIRPDAWARAIIA